MKGYVGLANAVLLAQHHDVVAVDIITEITLFKHRSKALGKRE